MRKGLGGIKEVKAASVSWINQDPIHPEKFNEMIPQKDP
jgi:hypothetical protein